MDKKLVASLVGAGVLCGVLMNVALQYPPWNFGGILGGVIVGILMIIL